MAARTSGPSWSGRPIVRIHVLGTMRATTYLGDDILPRGKKARAILGYLLSAAGHERLALGWRPCFGTERLRLRLTAAFAKRCMRFLGDGPPCRRTDLGGSRNCQAECCNLCWIDAAAVLAPETTLGSSSRSELSCALHRRGPRAAGWHQPIFRSMAFERTNSLYSSTRRLA